MDEVVGAQAGEVAPQAPPPPPPTPRQALALMEAREYSLDEMLNQPCRLHSDSGYIARHLLKECQLWNSTSESKHRHELEVDKLATDFATMMIVATVDKNDEKRIDHVVYATMTQRRGQSWLP